MPQHPLYRSHIWAHWGRVAGLGDELGISAVIDQATAHNPEMRMVTAGQAVKAMGLNGLGFVNQQLSLIPHFFQHKPTSRLLAPAVAASHLHEATLGRALETLYAYGVTDRYRLMAATAARRVGLAPTVLHRDRTRVHGEWRFETSLSETDSLMP